LPATGRLLRRLERRGLLALETDPDDRRATRARLTEAGQATRDAILAYRRRMLTDVAQAVTLPGDGDLASGLAAIAAELRRYA
jgi:DNA-binding MarR family transcriptional regulator